MMEWVHAREDMLTRIFSDQNRYIDFKIRVQFTRYPVISIRVITYSQYELSRTHKPISIEAPVTDVTWPGGYDITWPCR